MFQDNMKLKRVNFTTHEQMINIIKLIKYGIKQGNKTKQNTVPN